jgi:nicotinate-nucleotide adenylyltransferase
MRLGIFGGTFDPPHHAHRILAAECLAQLKLDRVLWVLTPNPPHKISKKISALEKRQALLEAAIMNEPLFELSRVDIDRLPPHYAYQTVQLLSIRYPEDALVYLMGGDSLRDLQTWKNPGEFVAACQAIGVMHRPGEELDLDGLEETLPGITAKLEFVDAPLLEISGSEIRARLRSGGLDACAARYYLPEAVFARILELGMYKR